MLEAVYYDRCCDGLEDVTKHFLCTIFPAVPRAPYADGYHGSNKVIQTFNAGAEFKQEASAQLARILRFPDEDSVQLVINYLKKRPQSRGGPVKGVHARTKALSKDFAGRSKTIGRDKKTLTQDLDFFYQALGRQK